MEPTDWRDPRIAKLLFKKPAPPTAFQTEAFVSRVMARLETPASPFWAWLTGRWAVPALGLGTAAVFLSIFYSAPVSALVVDASVSAGDSPSAWVLATEEE